MDVPEVLNNVSNFFVWGAFWILCQECSGTLFTWYLLRRVQPHIWQSSHLYLGTGTCSYHPCPPTEDWSMGDIRMKKGWYFFTSAKLMYSFGGYEGSEQPDIYGKSEEEKSRKHNIWNNTKNVHLPTKLDIISEHQFFPIDSCHTNCQKYNNVCGQNNPLIKLVKDRARETKYKDH